MYPNHCHLLLHPFSPWLLDHKGTNISDGKTQGVVLDLGKRGFVLAVHLGHPTGAAAAALVLLTVAAF